MDSLYRMRSMEDMFQLRGHRRYNAITALRSLFRFAERRGPTFADPTRHLRGGRGAGRTVLPMTAEQIRAVQQAAATPAQRLAIALAAVHAARPGAIRDLTLEDIDLPSRRIIIAGHRQPLGELTRDALLDRWPSALGGRGGRRSRHAQAPRLGPAQQFLTGAVAAQRAVLHPQLEQEPLRLPDRRPRRNAQHLYDLGAVQVRPDLVKLLLRRQRLDPPLQVVVGALKAQRLGLVPCRAIGPLLRRNIVIDAETARLVAAAVQAALQAGAPSRPPRPGRRVPAADCEPLF
jgi:integrase